MADAEAGAAGGPGDDHTFVWCAVLVVAVCWALHVVTHRQFNHFTAQRALADHIFGFVLFSVFVLCLASWAGSGCFWVAVGLLALYGVVYAVVRFLYPSSGPQVQRAEEFMCCWQDLYYGRAFPLYNIIFSPILLVFHAIRIQVGTCLGIYVERLFWLAAARCFKYYEDPDFPPDDTSLGSVQGDAANKASGKSNATVIWVRAGDFGRKNVDDKPERPLLHGSDMNLFCGKIEPNDVKQGALGDCWLLAAMAALAENPGAIDATFITKELNPRGKYQVWLFDAKDDKWKIVTVDDYVPCKRSNYAVDGVARGADGMPLTLYARPHKQEVWSLILEKAVAKLCGSYAAIEGGFTEWGITCLTGKKAWRYVFDKEKAPPMFYRMDLKNEVGVNLAFTATSECHNEGDFFNVLQYYDRNGAILCCGGVTAAGEDLGLKTKHAYSLLQVTQATKTFSSQEYFRFVQIRNPWGDGEWTGAWSDSSELWEQYPYVAKQLGHDNVEDGAFWMAWEDFCKYWGYAGCIDNDCDISGCRMPAYETSRRDGPLRGCLKGCFDYWIMCQGPRLFFFNHNASDKTLTRRDFEDWGGCDPSGCYFRLFDKHKVQA